MLNSLSCFGYWQVQGEWSPVSLSLPEKHLSSKSQEISSLFHSWASTYCFFKDRLLMCSNLLSPAVPSFEPWCWFSSSWHLKSQSDPFCPIALTMCSDTRCAGGGSHRSSGITRGDLPALTEQCGGGCIRNGDPSPRLGLSLGWVGVTELLWGSDLLAPWGSTGWEGGRNYRTLFLLSFRGGNLIAKLLEMETRKRKKGEREKQDGIKNKSAHLPISPLCQGTLKPFYQTRYLLVQFHPGWVSIRPLWDSCFFPNYRSAFTCHQGRTVIHSLNRWCIIHSKQWYGGNVTLGLGSSLSVEDTRVSRILPGLIISETFYSPQPGILPACTEQNTKRSQCLEPLCLHPDAGQRPSKLLSCPPAPHHTNLTKAPSPLFSRGTEEWVAQTGCTAVTPSCTLNRAPFLHHLDPLMVEKAILSP